MGGVAAVSMVMQKLPITWLQSHVPDIIKAALAVLKHLPGHASLEQAQLLKALTTVMHLVVPKVQAGGKYWLMCCFCGLSGRLCKSEVCPVNWCGAMQLQAGEDIFLIACIFYVLDLPVKDD